MSVRESLTGDCLDGLDFDDEKDDSKRKSRNLSEKKRRDQFNTLVTELGAMVSSNTRKMDKTTVLKTTISFLKQHNEQTSRSATEEIREDWKPTFLSNEEFTHLMLEALDGFILVLGTDGHILYISEGLSSLLGYMPSSLHHTTLYEIVDDLDKIPLYNHLNNINSTDDNEQQLRIQLHIRRNVLVKVEDGGEEEVGKGTEDGETTKEELTGEKEADPVPSEPHLELVELSGYFRKWVNPDTSSSPQDGNLSDDEVSIKSGYSQAESRHRTFQPDKTVFVATGRLVTPQLIRELPVVHHRETEFISRHSLEWKFLFLDHRAPPIIGYLPFELLGTSGYDYYHVDDLDRVAASHQALRQTGENISCYYRFLTKGQQWIWLQTRYYITYHQWNSKPEFIVATHKVVSYKEVQESNNSKQKRENEYDKNDDSSTFKSGKSLSFRSGSPTWSSRSSQCESSTGFASSSRISQGDRESQCGSSHTGFQSRYSRVSRGTRSINSDIGFTPLHHDDIVMSDSMSESMNDIAPRPSALIMPPSPSALSIPRSPSAISMPRSPVILTRAQQLLQQQLRTKHSELSRRIAAQQLDLARLGDQLLLTTQSPPEVQPLPFYSSEPQLSNPQQLQTAKPQLQQLQFSNSLEGQVDSGPQLQRRLSNSQLRQQQQQPQLDRRLSNSQQQQQQRQLQQLSSSQHLQLLDSQTLHIANEQLQLSNSQQLQLSNSQQQQQPYIAHSQQQSLNLSQQLQLSNSQQIQLSNSQEQLQYSSSHQQLQMSDSQQLPSHSQQQLQLSSPQQHFQLSNSQQQLQLASPQLLQLTDSPQQHQSSNSQQLQNLQLSNSQQQLRLSNSQQMQLSNSQHQLQTQLSNSHLQL